MKERLRVPAEWEPHAACWLAFPYLNEEWPANLEQAQRSVAALCRAIADPGEEQVRLLVKDERVEDQARSLIGESPRIDYLRADYGDCWLRDTTPLLGHDEEGDLGGLCFQFNGWGGKYPIPFDDGVGRWLTNRLAAKRFESPLILEGGALEPNGRGVFLTTASCVLNANRNPGLTRDAFERALDELVSTERVIWFNRGLDHDHTDGHVDMLARFVNRDTVLCMRPEPGAPNEPQLREIRATLRASGLTTIELPPPPAVSGPNGSLLPATYCNFYLANGAVIVPVYGIPEDQAALAVIGDAFTGREVVGLRAQDLLCGGGAFHCATQPLPSVP